MSILVTVSGVDLAGKTTQLTLLTGWLARERISFEQVWFRPGYSNAMNSLRRAIRLVRPGALPPAGPSSARDRAFSRADVRRAWASMAVVDSIVHYGVNVRLALARSKVVLCDRYVEDAALDLQLRFPEFGTHGETVIRAISPTPALALLLLLPWEEVLRRVDSKAEPFPDSIDERRARFRAYSRLAERGGFQVIDATRPVADIHAELRELVISVLRSHE